MWFVIFVVGLFVGSFIGVFLMCLLQMAREPDECECGCTGDCSQGGACTCIKQ